MKNKVVIGGLGSVIALIGFTLILLGGRGSLGFLYIEEVTWIFVFIGTGLFGVAMGEVLKNKAIKSNPKEAKKVLIEQKDERNKYINQLAKSKAYDVTNVFLLGSIIFFGFLGDFDKTLLIILIMAVAISWGVMFYHTSKLKKEM